MVGSDDFVLSSDQLPTMFFYVCLSNHIALIVDLEVQNVLIEGIKEELEKS